MSVADEIKQEQKEKFKQMTFKGKLSYIWDYYKVVIIVAVIAIIGLTVLIRDYRDNLKPTVLYAAFINSNFAADPSNTIEEDYIRFKNVDTDKEHVYISFDFAFMENYFDTTAIAYQQKLVAMYQSGDLDAVIGPVWAMETTADCGGYADWNEIIPEDLLKDLEERGYEFYYYSGRRYTDDEKSYLDEDELKEIENFKPYLAGIYLDNCSYLNNMGEYGAYDMPEDEDDRVIFTIPVTTKRLDNAIEFLEFITE